ncbi:MAG: formylglycine-generating enzyme family protein [Leptospiraceae bacterium]|nr:formylglycine-generating enzyme family protein [Leptospiraceae bacterium]
MKLAEKRVERFKRSYEELYGESHFIFACHAAFPVLFTSELLYLIWQNFSQDEYGNFIPFSRMAVADLLHSPFCSSIGPKTYEMDKEIRSLLLEDLRKKPEFGEKRIKRIAAFLLQYAERKNPSEIEKDLKDSHLWTAMAELNKVESSILVNKAFVDALEKKDKSEILRIGFLLDSLIQRYPHLENIRNLTKAYQDDIYGDKPETRYAVISDSPTKFDLKEIALPTSVIENLRINTSPEEENEITPVSVFIIFTDAESKKKYSENVLLSIKKLEYVKVEVGSMYASVNIRVPSEGTPFMSKYSEIQHHIQTEKPKLVVFLGDNPPQFLDETEKHFTPTMLDMSELFPLKACETQLAMFLYPDSQSQAIDTMWRVEHTIGIRGNETKEEDKLGFLQVFLQDYQKTQDYKKAYTNAKNTQVAKEEQIAYVDILLNYKREKWRRVVQTKNPEFILKDKPSFTLPQKFSSRKKDWINLTERAFIAHRFVDEKETVHTIHYVDIKSITLDTRFYKLGYDIILRTNSEEEYVFPDYKKAIAQEIQEKTQWLRENILISNEEPFKTETIELHSPSGMPVNQNSIGTEFIYIPAGEFMMGQSPGDEEAFDREKPAHKVRLTTGFYMSKYPLTQRDWLKIIEENPSSFKDDLNCPVERVSWNDVQEFIKRLNEMETPEGDPPEGRLQEGRLQEGRLLRMKYRLPTEAEWEYAARAGSETKYYFGNEASELKNYAWYDENSDSKTHPVGEKLPNEFGLYDMLGNVWEWCEDWYDSEYYKKSPLENPFNGDKSDYKVYRGGSWYDHPLLTRVSFRVRDQGLDSFGSLGFRLVFAVPQ